jgi:hypothetical protein
VAEKLHYPRNDPDGRMKATAAKSLLKTCCAHQARYGFQTGSNVPFTISDGSKSVWSFQTWRPVSCHQKQPPVLNLH